MKLKLLLERSRQFMAIVAITAGFGIASNAGATCKDAIPIVASTRLPSEVETGAAWDIAVATNKNTTLTSFRLISGTSTVLSPQLPEAVEGQTSLHIPISVDVDLPRTLRISRGPNKIWIEAQDSAGHCSRKGPIVITGKSPPIFAVIVGINRFEAFNSPLTYARYDAVAIRDYLQGDRGVPPENITLLVDEPAQGEVPILNRKLATRTAFLRSLADLADTAPPDSTTLVFLSTHGYSIDDPEHFDDKTYVVFSESNTHHDFEMLAKKDFDEYIGRIRSKTKILFLDSCYSGFVDGTPGAKGAKFIAGAKIAGQKVIGSEPRRPAGAYVIASSKADQLSWELDELKHGVFTYFLLEAAKKAKVENGNQVLVRDVYDYLQQKVPEEVRIARDALQEVDRVPQGDGEQFVWAYR